MKKPYSGDSEQTCPYRLGEKCEDACPTCAMFLQFRGMNPNTGREVDSWECAIAFTAILLIENSQQQRHTAAAVESFRNEFVRSNRVLGIPSVREDVAGRLASDNAQIPRIQIMGKMD